MRTATSNLLKELKTDELRRAYRMGRDCALHGANTENCHFTLFATPELTAAWERGKASVNAKPTPKRKGKPPSKRLKISFTFPDGLDHIERRMMVALIRRLVAYQQKRNRRTTKANKF